MELEKRHWIGIAAGVLALVGLVLIVLNLRGPGREEVEIDELPPDEAPVSAGRVAPGASVED